MPPKLITVEVQTLEGPRYLRFESIEEAVKQIGAANLETMKRWVRSLPDTQPVPPPLTETLQERVVMIMHAKKNWIHPEEESCKEFGCVPFVSESAGKETK